MYEDDFWNFIKDFTDYLNSHKEAIQRLKEHIAKLVGVSKKPKREWAWNPDKIKWERAQGTRGEFEKSEDVNNPEFKVLLKDLAKHNGKLTRDGWFYWVYRFNRWKEKAMLKVTAEASAIHLQCGSTLLHKDGLRRQPRKCRQYTQENTLS